MPEVGWPDFATAAGADRIDAELLAELAELVRIHRRPF